MRNRIQHISGVLGGVFFLLALTPLQVHAQQEPYQVKTFRVDEHPVVRILTQAGDIEVIGEKGREEVRIELYVSSGISVWSRSRNMDNYRFSTVQRGREIFSSVEPRGSFAGDHVRFSYRIYAPPEITLRLQTSSGDIDVENVNGRQHELSTSNGDITVRNSRGTIYANTNRGDISLDNCEGEIRLRILGGEIDARRIRGAMIARITRGDIRARFAEVIRGLNLSTTHGDISLYLPVQPFEFSLRGTEVHFSTTGSFEGIRRNNYVEGSYREGGGPKIILETQSGSVTVETE